VLPDYDGLSSSPVKSPSPIHIMIVLFGALLLDYDLVMPFFVSPLPKRDVSRLSPEVNNKVPAALLRFIIFSQSARCLLSSSLLFGGRNDGLVLLTTLSNILGPVDCEDL
jgi:hypothetical protein